MMKLYSIISAVIDKVVQNCPLLHVASVTDLTCDLIFFFSKSKRKSNFLLNFTDFFLEVSLFGSL